MLLTPLAKVCWPGLSCGLLFALALAFRRPSLWWCMFWCLHACPVAWPAGPRGGKCARKGKKTWEKPLVLEEGRWQPGLDTLAGDGRCGRGLEGVDLEHASSGSGLDGRWAFQWKKNETSQTGRPPFGPFALPAACGPVMWAVVWPRAWRRGPRREGSSCSVSQHHLLKKILRAAKERGVWGVRHRGYGRWEALEPRGACLEGQG